MRFNPRTNPFGPSAMSSALQKWSDANPADVKHFIVPVAIT
jgi:hypothetical protein